MAVFRTFWSGPACGTPTPRKTVSGAPSLARWLMMKR